MLEGIIIFLKVGWVPYDLRLGDRIWGSHYQVTNRLLCSAVYAGVKDRVYPALVGGSMLGYNIIRRNKHIKKIPTPSKEIPDASVPSFSHSPPG